MTTMTKAEWQRETKALSKLAGPLVINNLAVAGMQFADAVMSGQLGAKALAAVAVGASVWFLGMVVVMGILMALSPIVARLHGAGDYALVGRYTRQGAILGIAGGVVIILLGQIIAAPLLAAFGIDEDFRDLTVGYIGAITWGAPGVFVFFALRFTNEGIGRMAPIMYTSLFSLACNVFLNYVLMFGHFGAPAMGVVGCGYASAITMWLIMFVLAFHMVSSRIYARYRIFEHLARFRWPECREVLLLGAPITVAITAETGLFSAVSILMGTRGTEIMAAHQVAINFCATMFMIPLALSSAITVHVGHLLGAGDNLRARRSGGVGIAMCAAFMSCSAVFMLVFRDAVVGLYTDDLTVRSIAISLLLMAAIFQVADGVQIGAAGALRGYKDTRMPMVINTFSFWVLAFPAAYLAAITFQAPPSYVWAGFVLGLSVAAILLTWRYARLSRQTLDNVLAVKY